MNEKKFLKIKVAKRNLLNLHKIKFNINSKKMF